MSVKCFHFCSEESLVLPWGFIIKIKFVLQLEMIGAVREVQTTIQVMLARQEFTAALDLIATTQDLLRTELSTIRSLK